MSLQNTLVKKKKKTLHLSWKLWKALQDFTVPPSHYFDMLLYNSVAVIDGTERKPVSF